MIKSVYSDQDDILNAIETLHCPEGFQCDLTYGNGIFYRNRKEPVFKFDIDPQKPDVTRSCSTDVFLPDGMVSNVMFDPPFLTYIKSARDHNSIMAKRFGGYYTYDELKEHYTATFKEAHRILAGKGILIVKCQDIVHNHRLHPTHINIMEWIGGGFRLKDFFILEAKTRMKVNNHPQKHARIYHSYFMVFEKKEIKK